MDSPAQRLGTAGALSRILLLSLALTGTSLAGGRLNPERSKRLTTYCNSARPFLRHPALDPASLSAKAVYVAPLPTVVLGQKVSAASRRLAMEGFLVLGLVINSAGRVAHLAVVEKSEHAELDSEALSILKDAEFSPATLDGSAIRACMLLGVRFKLGS